MALLALVYMHIHYHIHYHIQTLMNARMSYLTSANTTPCAPTLKVSTSADVLEVTRETAGFAPVRSSLYTMYIAVYYFVQILCHVICHVLHW